MTTEFEYLAASSDVVSENIEKWMAVIGKNVVAVGESAKEVLERAMELHPGEEPFIAKFPKQTILLL